jgi:hypothetical protein
VLNRKGQVLDSLSLTGCIAVTANNVTVRNTRIRGLLGCYAGIRTHGGHNFLVEDAEVDGLGKDGNAFGIAQQNGSRTYLHCNVHGVGVAFTANASVSIQIHGHGAWSPSPPATTGTSLA